MRFDVLQCSYSSPGCGGTASCSPDVHAIYGFNASGASTHNVVVPSGFDLGDYVAAARTVDRFLGTSSADVGVGPISARK